MRRAQSILEYAFLISLVAAAIIALLVYMKRGFQGNLRQLSEQTGAGYYDPRNTSGITTETKHTTANITSSSSSSTSTNKEEGTSTVNRSTNESLGDLSGDTWH